jgi:two-component system C4-dicarboxylate transport sensor histidine kinase DctB
MLGVGLLQRRARLLDQIARQLREAETLEARVAARTRDLDAANRQLLQEVDERRRTENRLRQTQADLVQAGKLAALGQMSAALSHEFNQPLAAVKSYAENARTFLERGRLDEVASNITHISKMADRMAKISQHLRNFARRPQDQLRPISLHGVISDALALMQPRLSRDDAKVVIVPSDVEDIWVTAGQVRLQQVLVNLISNALDAMQDCTHPQMDLSVAHTDGMVCVSLRDYGPGIDDAVRDQIFDPFVTTKAPGHGLGLGLSISYNIVHDFGGTLTATNHPMGGAIFTVTLRPAKNPTPPALPVSPKSPTKKENTP